MENIVWTPEKFLSEFGSTLLVKIRGGSEKVSSLSVQQTQQQFLHTKCQRLSKEIQLYIVQVLQVTAFVYNILSGSFNGAGN